MAYAAVISLKKTIERCRFVNSCTSLETSLQFLHNETCSLQILLQTSDNSKTNNINRKRLNALDAQIRDAVCQLEDAIDQPHFSNHQETIHSFTQTLNEVKPAYTHELRCPSPQDHEDKDDNENGCDSKMVGLSDQYMEVKDKLTSNSTEFGLMFVSLWGMAGIGKTALARKLFQDPKISGGVDVRAFVTVGQAYRSEDVLLDILKQVMISNVHRFDENMLAMEGAEDKLDALQHMVSDTLEGRSFFIVLDDVWDPELFYQFAGAFPWQNGKTQVLVTTRLQEVAEVADPNCRHKIRFLDKKESWNLLRWKVFGDQEHSCPSELEKAGKKIGENCEGLPLTIVKVTGILSKAEKTTELWNKVAADKKNSVFIEAYDRMHNVLYQSYDYLDQYLKPCFLYMGVFPQNYEIHRSNLFNLWIVEGLVLEHCSAAEVFEQLDSNSLVVVQKQSLVVKTFSLISPFWYLCNKEATKNKFFHGLESLADVLSEEDLKSQRRLSIRNKVLFSIKDARDSIASVSTLRSLLCTGPYHPYPVPICSDFRLLRVLDALTLRFYEFPMEVLKLVRLTYLALTFSGDTPVSISRLHNLHYLIINRHWNIVKSYINICSSSYLPMEIWDMKQLKHLQVIGSSLPQPHEGHSLPNLLTLLGTSPQSCSIGVLQKLPNLRKLGIQLELPPRDHDHDHEPLCVFDHISRLRKLEKLKCIIENPEIVFKLVAPPVAPLSILPSSLVKLTLRGFGYPWKEMSKISSLPNLAILKLRCYAFRGPKWEVGGKEFPKLRYLVIEETDLVEWTFSDNPAMYKLELLCIRHCYKLDGIPLGLGMHLKKIEVVDCKAGAMACAKQLKENKFASDDYPLDVTLHSS